MKAVIFAAGSGHRLRAITPSKPKCLIEIAGRSLLSRSLAHLEAAGIRKVALVVGFARQEIHRAVAADSYSGEVRWVFNDQFSRGNMLSLWAARQELDDDVLLMDADVLYCSELLHRLIRSTSPTALLIDETVKQVSEECMVTGHDGRVESLSKTMPADAVETGETVGFLKICKQDIPAMLRSVRACVEAEELDLEYEDALRDFIEHVHVGYEKIGGLPWIEIDFPEDVVRASRHIYPLIEARDARPTMQAARGKPLAANETPPATDC